MPNEVLSLIILVNYLTLLKVQIKIYNLLQKHIESSISKKKRPFLQLFYGDQNDFPDDLHDFYYYLSNKEIERSKRFTFERDERVYVISHALLNKRISEQAGVDFDQLKINYFAQRKPYVEDRNIDFNLSHSSGYFAFALSAYENVFVGVDIEVFKNNLDIEPIMKNYFHKNELHYVLNFNFNDLPPRQKFYEIWTRKEAFLKMLGTGLSEQLSEIDMCTGEREFLFMNNTYFDRNYFTNIFIYTLNLSKNVVLSISINSPAIIIPFQL